jgi:hypothetical protein
LLIPRLPTGVVVTPPITHTSKPDDYVGGIGASSVDEPGTIAFGSLDHHVAN